MNAIMYRRQLSDLRWSALWYAAGSALYALVIVSFYPYMRDNAQVWEDILEIYPEALRRAFGIEEMTTLPGFVGAEFLSAIWPLIISVFAIMAGTATVAQEIERGTVELWLSVPERRWRLLAAKLLALLTDAALMIAVVLAALAVGARLVDESLGARGLAALGVTMLAFTLAVLGYAALFSALLSERGKAAGLATGVTLGGYLAFIVSGISPRWEFLKYVSIFSAYKPQDALAHGSLNITGVAILVALGLACCIAALIQFERRDMI